MKSIRSIAFLFWLSVLLACTTKDKEAVYITDDIYRFYLGDWECTVIKDAAKSIPLAAFFDSVSVKGLIPVIEKYGLDPSSIKISINILVLRNGKQTVIIDPGLGNSLDGNPSNSGQFIEKLKEAGINSRKVDYVIISHGHWDHIGGIARSGGNLHFPNAKYVMQEKEWEYWTSEKNLGMMPETYALWAREDLPPIKEKVTLIKGDEEIVTGITAIPAFGHTPGQLGLLIESGSEKLLYLADAIHFSFQIAAPNYSPYFDMDPKLSSSTRKNLIKKAYDSNYKVFGFHFEFPGIGRIKKGEKFEREFESL
jgi:glyoxylase-like metal-dependent hydrolase (beta-lactamase superfamily II)